MQLVTTAEERLWPAEGPMVFLGEWCRRYARRGAWTERPNRVLPYPFDDREALFTAYQRCSAAYVEWLPQVARALNAVHGESHSERYWEITVGYWLREYIEVMYERYSCLRAALAGQAGEASIITLDPACWRPPRDSIEFGEWYCTDLFNAQLYSQIARIIGRARLHDVRVEAVPAAAHEQPLWKRLRARLKHVVSDLSLRSARGATTALVSTYFPPADLACLGWRLRSVPVLDTPRWMGGGSPLDSARRTRLVFASHDEFSEVIARTLPVNLPQIFVEDRAALVSWARAQFPAAPRGIVTANAFAYNDGFKHWAASHAERGVPYVILQHGGSYGVARWNSSEDYEIRVADRYLTFGWRDESAPANVVPFAASRLRFAARTAHPRRGDILVIVVSFPRYAYTMYSVPVGPQVAHYLRGCHDFVRGLGAEAQRRVRYRPYTIRYGWDDDARLRDAVPGVRLANVAIPMLRQVRRASVVVVTFNATAFMECFVLDVPTVMFWDPALWEVRPSAVAAFDALRAARVLHDTPHAAAAHVTTVADNPLVWWHSPTVRAAVAGFCARYGRSHEVGIAEWAAEFADARGVKS